MYIDHNFCVFVQIGIYRQILVKLSSSEFQKKCIHQLLFHVHRNTYGRRERLYSALRGFANVSQERRFGVMIYMCVWKLFRNAIIPCRSLLHVYSFEQLGRLTRNIGTGELYRVEYTLHFKVLVPSTHTTKYLAPLLGTSSCYSLKMLLRFLQLHVEFLYDKGDISSPLHTIYGIPYGLCIIQLTTSFQGPQPFLRS